MYGANSVTVLRLTGMIEQDGRVAVGDSINVMITFEPLSEIDYESALVIVSNDPDNPEVRVELSGVGTVFHEPAPVIELNLDVLDLGEVVVGENTFGDFTISNNGNAPLIIESIRSGDRAFWVDFAAGNEAEESPFHYNRTDESHSLLIDEATLDGSPLSEGSEVGVFTPGGVCAGAEPVEREGLPIGIAAWRDDPTTEAIDGFREDDDFIFRFWDSRSRRELVAMARFQQGPETFQLNAVSVLNLTGRLGNVQIEEAESYRVRVWFAPTDESEYRTDLIIVSNDPETPELSVALTGIGIRINHPPEVIRPIDRFDAPEDCGEQAIADLDEVFSDPDGDILSFFFECDVDLNLRLDDSNVLTVNPPPEYSGEANVILVALDDQGREARLLQQVNAESANSSFALRPLPNLSGERHLRKVDDEPAITRDLAAAHRFTLAILQVNDPPVIRSANGDPLEAVIDVVFSEGLLGQFVLRANDNDNFDSTLTWSLPDQDGLPNGFAFIDNGDGTSSFRWTPPFGSARQQPYTPTFRVVDPNDESDEIVVRITVNHINRPPMLERPIFPFAIDEDPQPARIVIADLNTVFVDPDGDVLGFGFEGRAELGLEITDNVLSIQPRRDYNSPRGDNVNVLAWDATDTTTQGFRITIRPINDPPGAFDLLSPVDGFAVDSTHYNVAFRWQYATNVDVDQIAYTVNLRVRYEQLDTTLRRGPVAIDSLTWNLGEVLLGLGLTHHRNSFDVEMNWSVSANDAEFTVNSTSQRRLTVRSPISVEVDGYSAPTEFSLSSAYPNPFNSSCHLEFALPVRSKVRLIVCDQRGRQISGLVDGEMEPGHHTVTWDATSLPAGIYLAQMEASNVRFIQKLVLIK